VSGKVRLGHVLSGYVRLVHVMSGYFPLRLFKLDYVKLVRLCQDMTS